MQKQKGLVLFFSLVVLLLMTVIGVALAVNSGQSLRMAGAGSERVEAMAKAHGEQAQQISNKQGSAMANMTIVESTNNAGLGVDSTFSPLTAGDVNCQRSTKANSANLISCRRIEVSSTAEFGRNKMGQLTVVSGVEQEVLTGS